MNTSEAISQAAGSAKRRVNDAKQWADDAGPMIDKASRRAKAFANQGMDTAARAAQQLRDGVSSLTDGATVYTKKNPVKAVMIAAVSGALIFGLFKALASSRD